MNRITLDCPVCGAGTLTRHVGTETFEYRGQTRTIPDYVTYVCDACGESVVDAGSLKTSGRMLKDFQRKVDGLLTGQQIKEIRARLGLTQEQLADLIGGGLKSVARYESGQVCQSRGMDNLLRILDAYPETLRIIQRKERPVQESAKVVYIEDARNKNAYRLAGRTFETGEVGYGF